MQSANQSIDGGEFAGIPSRPEANQAFGNILSGSLSSLHRRAYQLLGNSADAEDAVQDALLAAYTHLDQFKGQAQMSTWMAVILHNCARMQLRSRLRHVHISLDERNEEVDEHPLSERLADWRPTPEDECRHSELSERMMRFRRQLSPTLRRAFQLRDIEGLSIREAARILGVPHGTVKAQSARARKKLKEFIRRTLEHRSPNRMRAAISGR